MIPGYSNVWRNDYSNYDHVCGSCASSLLESDD